MSKKKKTPTFVYTLPLKVELWQEHILTKRFEANRQIYNAVLGEMLKRLKAMRSSEIFKQALATDKEEEPEKRTELFKQAHTLFAFSEFEAHAYATTIKNSSYVAFHSDAHTPQTIASRVWKALECYRFKQYGKPRFKGFGQMKSIDSKSTNSPLKFKDGRVVWKGLELLPIYDQKDKEGVEAYALQHKVKYIRLLKKMVHGKEKYFVQLILEGEPLIKKRHLDQFKQGVVGLDHGPSVVAAVSETEALLEPFGAEIEKLDKNKRALQRKLARMQRANNPDNYEKDSWVKKDKHFHRKQGKIKKGKKTWKKSNGMVKLQQKINKRSGEITGSRKTAHGNLANRFLKMGSDFKVEKVSAKGWQKTFGRSVANNAPGMFMDILKRKAENAGGSFEKFKTWTTRLSQTCVCGSIRKKHRNERWHSCDCGNIQNKVQRDLFSAYLATHVADDRLDTSKALTGWMQGVESLLMAAVSEAYKSANGWISTPSCLFGTNGKSGSPLKLIGNLHEVNASQEEEKSA